MRKSGEPDLFVESGMWKAGCGKWDVFYLFSYKISACNNATFYNNATPTGLIGLFIYRLQ